jgi:ABC-type multidrug transport system fused ATPase/permease subunit
MRGILQKLFFIMERPFRRKAFALQCYLIIGVLFESIGLSLVIPLVNVITDVNHPGGHIITRYIKHMAGNVSNARLALIMLGCFVTFFLLKTFFLSFLLWKQSGFTQSLSRNISTRLFRGYLFQPYTFFLDKNSGILMKNIIAEVGSFTGYVQALMFLQTELSVLAGIVVTLLFLEPVAAVIVLCFVGGISYLLFSFSKKRISGWGRDRQVYDGLRSKDLLQGINGVTELKLFHKEDHFTGRYDKSNQLFYDTQRSIQFMLQAQRPWLELVVIVSVAILSFVVISGGRSVNGILPSLSLFLFAALRLMPSANRILSNLQTMRFTRPGVELVYNEFSSFGVANAVLPGKSKTIKQLKDSIRFEDISFTYPFSENVSLRKISITIRAGSVVGIVGPSGSGKTTLMNILTGLLQPGSGRLLVDDVDMTGDIRSLQPFIGYVPQNIFLIDDTLRRNIAFGIPDEEIDSERLAAVMAAAQLQTYSEGLPDGIDTVVGERGSKLSGGQRQRVGIARALYPDPAILILDEGTSSLDDETEKYIMDAVAGLKGKLTIILVAHRSSTVQFCDAVFTMQDGAIISAGKQG